MSISEKISYLWQHHYERAVGCSHADPFGYADAQVSHIATQLRVVERRQAHSNGLPQRGCRAGRRQVALRMEA